MTRAIAEIPVTEHLPPFNGATIWLNSEPLAPKDLKGKVVLVNFWTFTCINWLRTLPYIRAWYEKYKDHGLVIIGVHTPEFMLEHNIDTIQQAMERDGIEYPVVVDNNYAIWSAFDNHYWPALYFINAEGHIRYQQFGEGEYQAAERVIQQLLVESGVRGMADDLVSLDVQGVERAADWDNIHTSETYAGYQRATHFASPGGIVPGRSQAYDFPQDLGLNLWALSGTWTIEEEAAVLLEPHGKMSFHFYARDLNLVMAPVMPGAAIPFLVRLDGKPLRDNHGLDTDSDGHGTVTEPRLYQLIRQPQHITDHKFEIEFQTPGVQALVFTFG
jgi:thiol-disulfide isomerase/thioredoxin